MMDSWLNCDDGYRPRVDTYKAVGFVCGKLVQRLVPGVTQCLFKKSMRGVVHGLCLYLRFDLMFFIVCLRCDVTSSRSDEVPSVRDEIQYLLVLL